MLEQAAIGLLRLPRPAKRRFALLMAIAAQRYQKTGSVSVIPADVICDIGTERKYRKPWLGDVVFKHSRSILAATEEAGNLRKPISTRLWADKHTISATPTWQYYIFPA